jgi:hypothetical protein
LVVIDRTGRVAGFYSGTDADGSKAALARAKWLADHGG